MIACKININFPYLFRSENEGKILHFLMAFRQQNHIPLNYKKLGYFSNKFTVMCAAKKTYKTRTKYPISITVTTNYTMYVYVISSIFSYFSVQTVLQITIIILLIHSNEKLCYCFFYIPIPISAFIFPIFIIKIQYHIVHRAVFT